MARTLVISDIHGCYDEFVALLEKSHYAPEQDLLVVLGDMIDRGKQSKQVVELVMDLVEYKGAIALGGNHEDEFISWLEGEFNPEHRFLRIGGKKTVESYCKPHDVYGNGTKSRRAIHKFYSQHFSFIKNLPDYYEDEQHIFVHAGIDPEIKNWKKSSREQMRWIRDEFINGVNDTGKTIIFGHTPTNFLHKSKDAQNTNVWFSTDNKIGIDGGCSMGGQLHCLCIEDGSYQVFSVTKK